jgi:porphobilinogen synthase
MPGNYHWSVDCLPAEVEEIAQLGIPAVILFGLPAEKDPIGKENFDPEGIVQQAVQAIKDAPCPSCLSSPTYACASTPSTATVASSTTIPPTARAKVCPGGCLDNDATLEILSKVALTHAQAGCRHGRPFGHDGWPRRRHPQRP